MLATTFGYGLEPGRTPNASWMGDTSERVIGVLEEERATWQVTHARAEALRRARTSGVPAELLDRVVDGVVDLALVRAVPLTHESRSPSPRRCAGGTASVYARVGGICHE